MTNTSEPSPNSPSPSPRFVLNNKAAALLFFLALLAGLWVHFAVPPQWQEQRYLFDTFETAEGQLAFRFRGKEQLITDVVQYQDSPIRQSELDQLQQPPTIKQQWVRLSPDASPVLLKAESHLGLWSLLPAAIAISLCLLTLEPIAALLGGILVGGLMMGRFDLTDDILLGTMATEGTAAILILYLWLLGGLLGMWAKTGAAQAFAEMMTRRFVKGPRSAKVIAWGLGILFFQGGTMSTVLVGTTVKPMADQAKVSHEEMSYIVDSTASPIACLVAFNAWPAYVQALIFVPGVTFLATEADRISFFFSSIPFSFYAMLAVTGTLLLSLNITRFSGQPLRNAQQRALTTGQLDAPNAKPVSAKELHQNTTPAGYQPSHWQFLLPLFTLLLVAIISFIAFGSPKVSWAFAAALALCIAMAFAKGMSLGQVIEGFGNGLKGMVVASVVLVLAITIGGISKQLGGGIYLVELLGQQIHYLYLPVILQLLTMVTAFSTGTSWGTYAIAFPLAMPLAWAIADNQALAHPELFMAICFAAVLNGSVFGDQCSPISDTTILSAMTTGCDLMDHVKTQIIPAFFAASGAAVLWTLSAYIWA